VNNVARFVTRPSQPGNNECKPDIFVGVCVKNQSSLKPNTVYEIKECFGELIIKEVGESCIDEDVWSWSIGVIMKSYGNKMVLTKDEAEFDWGEET